MNPANSEGERAVLGSIMLDNRVAVQVATQLTAEDFTLDSHRKLFAAMVELSLAGKPVDPVTLFGHLGEAGLRAVGGMAYLSELPSGLPRRPNPKHYVHALRTCTSYRKLIALGEAMAMAAREQQSSPDKLIAKFCEDLLAASRDAAPEESKALRDVLPRVVERLEAQRTHQGLLGLGTGVDELDHMTGGIRAGQVWVIGARPGRGKTAFGMQVVAANPDVPAEVFELEMDDEDLASRLLAQTGVATAYKLYRPTYLNDGDMRCIRDGAKALGARPLWIRDTASVTTSQLALQARLAVTQHGVRLILLDYLMLVAEPREREARLKATRIIETMREVAKKLKVAVVVLSQLKRLTGGDDAEPTMADLKESGDIEAAAHVVLLLHTPDGDNHQPTGEDKIIVGKNRNGNKGEVRVRFDRDALLFRER